MELLPWQDELIRSSPTASLATIGPQGLPALVPICFAYVDGRFFFSIDEKPKSGRTLARLRNIDRDPRATLLFDRYAEDWTRLAWLRFECTAAALAASGWPEALAALRVRYPQYKEMALEAHPLVVLTPHRLVAWRWPASAP